MRTFITIALIAAAGFATPVQAQSTEETSSVRVPGVPMTPYKLTPSEFQDYRGTYLLANGKYLVLSNENKRFFAQVDDQGPIEIVPSGYNEFVGKSADIVLKFDEFRNGRNNDVIVSAPREMQIAAAAAARRNVAAL